MPDHVTSYDYWACAQTSHAIPCGKAVGLCNVARSNLYRWTSLHDANVVRKHQDIVKRVTGFPNVSRHLLKRQGKKLKRHGAVTLGRFGGNPAYHSIYWAVLTACRHKQYLQTGSSYQADGAAEQLISKSCIFRGRSLGSAMI